MSVVLRGAGRGRVRRKESPARGVPGARCVCIRIARMEVWSDLTKWWLNLTKKGCETDRKVLNCAQKLRVVRILQGGRWHNVCKGGEVMGRKKKSIDQLQKEIEETRAKIELQKLKKELKKQKR